MLLGLAVIAAGLVALISRTDSAAPVRAEALLAVDQGAEVDPRRAALVALAADQLESGSASFLAQVSAALANSHADRVIAAHNGRATAAVRTPSVVVTAGADHTLRLWDPSSGARLGERAIRHPIQQLVASGMVATIASVDEQGGVSLWDMSDPARPRARVLDLSRGRPSSIAGVAFNSSGTQLVVVHRSGYVERFDSVVGTPLSRVHLSDTNGRLPWHKHDQLNIAAIAVAQAAFERSTTLLVATAIGDVARINLDSLTGRTVITRDEVPGTPRSIAAPPSGGEPSIVVGASGGLLRWDEYQQEARRDRGIGVVGVAFDEGNLWIADDRGATRLPNQGMDSPRRGGRGHPAGSISSGPGGAAVTHEDGSVTLLAEAPQTLTLDPGGPSSVVDFGPDGSLLVTEGPTPNSIEALASVNPSGVDFDEHGNRVSRRPMRRYLPAASWWPQGEGEERDWYVNDAVVGERLVAAGGQDPPGNAVVLVWDRATGRPLRRLPLTTGGATASQPAIVTSVALLDDSALLAAYSLVQESVVLWSTNDWTQLATIDVGPADGFTVAPDEETIVVAGLSDEQSDVGAGHAESRLVFVDVSDRTITSEVPTNATFQAEFSPAGDTIATVSDDHLQFLTADGRREQRRPVPLHATEHTEIAWRPDGEVLAVSIGPRVVIVDPRDGTFSNDLPIADSGATVVGLAWSPDGTMLAAKSRGEGPGGSPLAHSPTIFRLAELRSRLCAVAGRPPSPAEWRIWSGGLPAPPASCSRPQPTPLLDARTVATRAVAYQREDHLFVAGTHGDSARIGSSRTRRFPRVRFVWSEEGALAWVAEGAVHLLEPDAARPQSWPCGCDGVAFAGEKLLSVARDGTGLSIYSSRRARPATIKVRGLPGFNTATVGWMSGSLIASDYESPPERSTPSVFFAIDKGGRARPLRSDQPGSVVHMSASASDGGSVAVVVAPSAGACYSPASVGIIDLMQRRIDYPDMPGPDRDPQQVRSLQYDKDGRLRAVIAPLCHDSSQSPPVGTLYYLKNGTWLGTGRRGYDVQPGRDGTAVLSSRPEGGALLLSMQRRSGPERPIARGVAVVAVRP